MNSRQILGNITAEIDSEMLDKSFFESTEYTGIVQHDAGQLIVGRRGTGKSSIFYKLSRHYSQNGKTKCLSISPEESDIIVLRGIWKGLNSDFRNVRAGMRVIWKYGLYMESLLDASTYYRVRDSAEYLEIKDHVAQWKSLGQDFISRVSNLISKEFKDKDEIEIAIGEITRKLNIKKVQEIATNAYALADLSYKILLDRLDEGYYSDEIGIGIVNGILQATLDVNQRKSKGIRCVIFVRDNIYRRIIELDQDFSRNIEGQEIRLHWNESSLLEVVASRIKYVFQCSGRPIDVWNQFVDETLAGIEGFRHCLRYTLYRPRDLISLINDSYFMATKAKRTKIGYGDIDLNATNVSVARYHDLIKEYGQHIPALNVFTKSFVRSSSEIEYSVISEKIDACRKDEYTPAIQQDMVIYNDVKSVIRVLYGVGFLGVKEQFGDGFIFCYDGKEHLGAFDGIETKYLIHPCYWMALEINGTTNESVSDKINDEYEVKVLANASDYRNTSIGRLIAQLGQIKEGKADSADFESWALDAMRIIFAGHLRNIRSKPNGANVSRRDIVGTNLSESPIARRIWESYQSRIVVFEVKNYKDMTIDEYTQCLRYMNGEYGNIAFLITRADDDNLRKGNDLDYFKEPAYPVGSPIHYP